MIEPTTLLFVPGDRPDRFDKAVASGADLVILDLEDAVIPESKDAAREHVTAWLAKGNTTAVRTNAKGETAERDVSALATHPVPVMVPEAEDPSELASICARLHPDSVVIALVESARGVLAAPELARVAGVTRLALGTFDLAVELGVDPNDREAMAGARQALVLASAAAGLARPIDSVTAAVDDPVRLDSDLAHAVRIGFGGKLCIHPRQVPSARAAFRPSEADVAWARRIMDKTVSGSAVLVDGEMVDKPVVERARRILNAEAS